MKLDSIVVISKLSLLQLTANQHAHRILVADDPKEAVELIKSSDCKVALFDDIFSPEDVEHFIKTTDKNNRDITVLVIAAKTKRAELTEKYVQAGAIDYLSVEDDQKKIKQALESNRNPRTSQNTPEPQSECFLNDLAEAANMAGTSEAMQHTFRMTKLVALSQCNPILVLGKTGTGKELIARTVHHIKCPKENFVALNCAALTANLLESELFGHVKGSFTGADKEKTGLLELAGEGVVFLDEISEMPLDLQAKLLRILQEKSFRKVGGIKTITCKATVVASSNRNLLEEVNNNRFRQDLYYRLNVCPIKLSPISHEKRKSDIRLLAKYFLKNSTIWPQKSQKIKSLTPLAFEALEKHNWPGNVRELKNVIDRAILLETTDKIGLSSIVIDDTDDGLSSSESNNNQVQDLSLAAAERELIARALREADGQKTKAASLLGITRATLYAKVKQYNIIDASKAPKQTSNKNNKPQPVACC